MILLSGPVRTLGKPIILCYAACIVALAFSLLMSRTKAPDCQTFPQTGKSVCGPFLDYWNAHGGVLVQGFPISDEFQEISPVDGQERTVQYFEKAVYELHPELAGPNNVQLEPLGKMRLAALYPNGVPAGYQDHALKSEFFSQTGYYIEEPFLAYWQQNGGAEQFGYPISKPFWEKSAADGQNYTVQYFERAELQLQPELSPPYQVLPAPLGTLRFAERYPHAVPSPTPTPLK
jgi:hypothetical protein